MKNNEKSTYGLNEQDVFNIKQDWYGNKLSLEDIANNNQVSIAQVMYAVNLNEATPVTNFDQP